MVRQERTAAGVILPAGQTPRGARPNRGGGAARPARLPGRSLEPVSNGRPRGMTAARKGTETGLQSGSPISDCTSAGGAACATKRGLFAVVGEGGAPPHARSGGGFLRLYFLI